MLTEISRYGAMRANVSAAHFCMAELDMHMMSTEVGEVVRQPKWYFAAYRLFGPVADEPDAFLIKALNEAGPIPVKNYEWGFSNIDEIDWEGRKFVFGYLYKNKPISERPRIDKDERIIRTEPLPDDLIARSAFFILFSHHLMAFHPQGNDIDQDRFGAVFAQLVESISDIGFVSFHFNLVTETKDIFRAIGEFSRIEQLKVAISLPNPRLNPRWEGIREDIEAVGAAKYEQEFVAPPGQGLSVGHNTRAHRSIEMASDGFGEAKLSGYDTKDIRKEVSTREHPVTIQAPSAETTPKEGVLGVLIRKFLEILERRDSNDSQD